jgi:hypothetical protein
MLNLTPLQSNELIIYADTVGNGIGDYFTIVFTNGFSKKTFSVIPNVTRRNTRFVELSVDLVGVNELDDRENGQIYLYPDGNWTYMVFQTNQPTLDVNKSQLLNEWNTEESFWNFADIYWNAFNFTLIDRGQAFLYPIDECENELEYLAYGGGNPLREAIVYVQGVPAFQFPCLIPFGVQYVVEQDTVTYCPVITIEDGGSLTVDTPVYLKQKFAPYGYC